MGGNHSRRKGADFERALVRQFREAMPTAEVTRGLQYRSGGECADVEVPCFWIEAKRHHKTSIRDALLQAVDMAPPGKWPTAVCKDDHEPTTVTMLLADFLDLVREWWALGEGMNASEPQRSAQRDSRPSGALEAASGCGSTGSMDPGAQEACK